MSLIELIRAWFAVKSARENYRNAQRYTIEREQEVRGARLAEIGAEKMLEAALLRQSRARLNWRWPINSNIVRP